MLRVLVSHIPARHTSTRTRLFFSTFFPSKRPTSSLLSHFRLCCLVVGRQVSCPWTFCLLRGRPRNCWAGHNRIHRQSYTKIHRRILRRSRSERFDYYQSRVGPEQHQERR